MAALLEIREYIRRFYSKFEVYIVPVLKFILAFVLLKMINSSLGYYETLCSTAIVLVCALLCSFLPTNFILVISAGFIVAHVYKLSWECAIVVLVLFLVLMLLYFRFSPKDAVSLGLLPIMFSIRIPSVVPICLGLVGGPASAVTAAVGVIVYYVVSFISVNSASINALDADGSFVRLKYLIDGIIGDKTMMMCMVAFAVVVIIVYVIRRLPVDHSWTYAMIAGAVMNIIIQLVGILKFDTNISVFGTIVSSVLAVLVAKVLQFFVFNVDYSRTENIQFEDDEYYYYVKAVPKVSISLSNKTVTKVESRKPVHPSPAQVSAKRPEKPEGPAVRPAKRTGEPAVRQANQSGVTRSERPVTARTPGTIKREMEHKKAKTQETPGQITTSIEGLESVDLKDL